WPAVAGLRTGVANGWSWTGSGAATAPALRLLRDRGNGGLVEGAAARSDGRHRFRDRIRC
ncbi:MAG: hypothetical protein WAL50_03350, partial [Kineosporiaceae bacterium]